MNAARLAIIAVGIGQGPKHALNAFIREAPRTETLNHCRCHYRRLKIGGELPGHSNIMKGVGNNLVEERIRFFSWQTIVFS